MLHMTETPQNPPNMLLRVYEEYWESSGEREREREAEGDALRRGGGGESPRVTGLWWL